MDENRYRLAGGALMLVAAALVVLSLQADHLRAFGTSVPTLLLAVVTYLLGVVAIAPVHLRAGEHRRLGANVLIGVGVLLFAWATVDGPPAASAVGLLALLVAGVLLYLEGGSGDAVTEPDAEPETETEA